MKKLLALITGIAMIGCNSAASRYIPKDIQLRLLDNYKFDGFSDLCGVQVSRYIIPEDKSKVKYIYVVDGMPHVVEFNYNKNIITQDGIIIDNSFPISKMPMNNSMMFRKPGDSYPGGVVK